MKFSSLTVVALGTFLIAGLPAAAPAAVMVPAAKTSLHTHHHTQVAKKKKHKHKKAHAHAKRAH